MRQTLDQTLRHWRNHWLKTPTLHVIRDFLGDRHNRSVYIAGHGVWYHRPVHHTNTPHANHPELKVDHTVLVVGGAHTTGAHWVVDNGGVRLDHTAQVGVRVECMGLALGVRHLNGSGVIFL